MSLPISSFTYLAEHVNDLVHGRCCNLVPKYLRVTRNPSGKSHSAVDNSACPLCIICTTNQLSIVHHSYEAGLPLVGINACGLDFWSASGSRKSLRDFCLYIGIFSQVVMNCKDFPVLSTSSFMTRAENSNWNSKELDLLPYLNSNLNSKLKILWNSNSKI